VLKVDQLGRVTEVPIKSSIDSRVHDRCNLRETVFRNANPSTMTIEEMARIEMQNMQASAYVFDIQLQMNPNF
jgi:signal-transduction protein with cAMP-binding, CBS, and nucleotidyltransferase domain